MKTSICRGLCTVLIACMLLAFSGCSVDGRYVLKELSFDGIGVSAEEGKMDPAENYIELHADGSAVMCINGSKADMEWVNGQLWVKGRDSEKISFQIHDGILTLTAEGAKMVFEKE